MDIYVTVSDRVSAVGYLILDEANRKSLCGRAKDPMDKRSWSIPWGALSSRVKDQQSFRHPGENDKKIIPAKTLAILSILNFDGKSVCRR